MINRSGGKGFTGTQEHKGRRSRGHGPHHFPFFGGGVDKKIGQVVESPEGTGPLLGDSMQGARFRDWLGLGRGVSQVDLQLDAVEVRGQGQVWGDEERWGEYWIKPRVAVGFSKALVI